MCNKYKKIIVISLIILLGLTGCSFSTGENKNKQSDKASSGDAENNNTTEEAISLKHSLVDENGFTTISDYVVTIKDNVEVLPEAKIGTTPKMVLVKGVNLKRTGYNGSWTRVKINDKEFYVYSNEVKKTIIKWATPSDAEAVSHVVYIDAAKQIMSNSEEEAVAPGSETLKKKATNSAIGVKSGKLEYEITLDVATLVQDELINRGYTVVMSRKTNDVNLSNVQRAQTANNSGAEIYVKLQAGKSESPATNGVMGFVTLQSSQYQGEYYAQSYELCNNILNAICGGTGAKRVGIYETEGLATINWSKMPTAVVNIGFLSNESDDELLSTYSYQDKIANYVCDGIDKYFEGEKDE